MATGQAAETARSSFSSGIDPELRGVLPGSKHISESTAYVVSEIASEAFNIVRPEGLSAKDFRADFEGRFATLFAGFDNQRIEGLQAVKGEDLVKDPTLRFCVARLAQEDTSVAVRKRALYLFQDAYHKTEAGSDLRSEVIGTILSTTDDGSRAVVKQALEFFKVNPGALHEAFKVTWSSGCTEQGPAAVLSIAGKLEAHLLGPRPSKAGDYEQHLMLDASREQALELLGAALQVGAETAVEHHLVLAVRRLLRPDLERTEHGDLALNALFRLGAWNLNHHSVVQYFARRLESGSAREQLGILAATEEFLRSERAAKVAFPKGNWGKFAEVMRDLSAANFEAQPVENSSGLTFYFATQPNQELFGQIKESANRVLGLTERRLAQTNAHGDTRAEDV